MNFKAALTATAAAAVALGLAACGSSKAPGVMLAPGAGATATTITPTLTAKTPTSGPLAKEPTITLPKTAAPTKLVTKNLITGTGKAAAEGDEIVVNYVGELYTNGKVFDSSWKRKETFETTLSTSEVIPGWVDGIVGMKVGGRRELIIPPKLGYGSTAETDIPKNSTLIYVVDLLAVRKG